MPNEDILAHLDFAPQCEFGSPGCYGAAQGNDCQRTAVWFVNYHACPNISPTPGTGTAIWCNHHLQTSRLMIETMISDAGTKIACPCGHAYNTPADFVWGAKPLNTQPTKGPDPSK